MNEIILAAGIPSAIFGLVIWWFKRYIDKKDKAAEKREKTMETFMLTLMKESRSTHILAEATAKAVQRIPDAHCNGDMTSALAEAERIQKEEEQFLFDQGIQHIFGK